MEGGIKIPCAHQLWLPGSSPHPLLSALVPGVGRGEGVSWEMPVLSEQMNAASAVGYLTGLTSFPWLCWQRGKLNSVPLLVVPAFLVV